MDFDMMREQIQKLPAATGVRRIRLWLFDMYRYSEDYDKLYKMVEELTNS